MKNKFDKKYHKIVKSVIKNGEWRYNKHTGLRCLTSTQYSAKYDLSSGKFPAITTKKLYINQMIGELLGFIRGVDNAADFRKLGCNFWDENANVTPDWVNNPNRKGEDDLGRIYGVQARDWTNSDGEKTDQLRLVYEKIKSGYDDRRMVVTHFNPGELHKGALPPCHMFYQFHLLENKLNLTFFQRSCDLPLGVPMNIASYSLLLMLMAQITDREVGTVFHCMGDVHIYENQLDLIKEQLKRSPYSPPKLLINPEIRTLEDLETWVSVDDFQLINYNHHAPIRFPFAA